MQARDRVVQAALRSLEWSGYNEIAGPDEPSDNLCPECEWHKPEGHRAQCVVGAAVAALDAEAAQDTPEGVGGSQGGADDVPDTPAPSTTNTKQGGCAVGSAPSDSSSDDTEPVAGTPETRDVRIYDQGRAGSIPARPASPSQPSAYPDPTEADMERARGIAVDVSWARTEMRADIIARALAQARRVPSREAVSLAIWGAVNGKRDLTDAVMALLEGE